VQALARLPQVTVTGRVPDVRPWLQAAGVTVAPLRIARGVQNKVLEAMAMARPVVATPAALQGLGGVTSAGVHCAESADAFANAVAAVLESPDSTRLVQANRDYVLEHYSWEASLAPLWPLLEAAA
jgi:glycosyltransferase involved in cell wall biosynthesis